MNYDCRHKVVREFMGEIEREFEKMVSGFGEILSTFNIAHWRVLMGVWERSGEISQTEAKKLIVNLPKYQSDKARRALIKELAVANLINKKIDKNDERRIILTLGSNVQPYIDIYFDGIIRLVDKYSKIMLR